MIKFSEWLKEKESNSLFTITKVDVITEIKKEIKDVNWKSEFGKGTGEFYVQDEKYEIEFDEADTDGYKVRGMKFYRIIDGQRILTYTESKEPLTVALTMKDQVTKYLSKVKPDVFGYLGNLDEKPRLRHYERLLNQLRYEHKEYTLAFTEDKGGERFFVLDKTNDKVDNKVLDKLRAKL